MSKSIVTAVALGVVTSLIASYIIAKYHSNGVSGSTANSTILQTGHGSYYNDLFTWLDGSPYTENNGMIFN